MQYNLEMYQQELIIKELEELYNYDDLEKSLDSNPKLSLEELKDFKLIEIENIRRVSNGITMQIDDDVWTVVGKFESILEVFKDYFSNLNRNYPFVLIPYTNVMINCNKVKNFNPYLINFGSNYSIPIPNKLSYINRVRFNRVIEKRKSIGVFTSESKTSNTGVVNQSVAVTYQDYLDRKTNLVLVSSDIKIRINRKYTNQTGLSVITPIILYKLDLFEDKTTKKQYVFTISAGTLEVDGVDVEIYNSN